MLKRDPKTRCEKKTYSKAVGVCRLYSRLQEVLADTLQKDKEIVEIRCNVPMNGLALGEYTSDFVCKRADGTFLVRECVERRFLTKPLTIRMLDASREHWRTKGITDWGLVIDKEAENVP